MDFINKVIAWIKANMVISIIIVLGVLFLFGKQLKRMLFGFPRRKKRKLTTSIKTGTARIQTRNKKPLPRSVGTKGYPAPGGGYIPFRYNKDGTVKKAWQVSGTVAAKSRMSRLRRLK